MKFKATLEITYETQSKTINEEEERFNDIEENLYIQFPELEDFQLKIKFAELNNEI